MFGPKNASHDMYTLLSLGKITDAIFTIKLGAKEKTEDFNVCYTYGLLEGIELMPVSFSVLTRIGILIQVH